MNTWKNIGIFAVSALSLGVVACGGSDGAPGAAGAAGAAGDKGPAGDATPASVGVIVPNIGIQDRELDVTITTNGVDLTQGAPTIDAGSGVTVSAIQVLSSTTLYAHFAIDAAATTGARDLKVNSGSNALTSKGGFKVATAINATVEPASPQQAGFVLLTADNNDAQHPFDATYDSLAGLFGGPLYPDFNLGVSTGGLLFSPAALVTTNHAEGAIVLLDPKAPGSVTPEAQNVNPISQDITETYAGDAVTVASRNPTTLTVGTPVTGQNHAALLATNLYKYNTATMSILSITTNPTGALATPDLVFYGAGGTSNDLQAFIGGGSLSYPTPTASTDMFITTFDDTLEGGAASDYGFDIAATSHTGTAVNEAVTAHATIGTAQALSALPGSGNGDIIVGTLAAGTEEDFYSVSLTHNDVVEIGTNTGKEVLVDLVDAASTSILDNGPVDSLGLSGATQTVAPSGTNTYYIHVTAYDTTAAPGAYLISVRKIP